MERARQQADYATRTHGLDPTHMSLVDVLVEWAQKRSRWKSHPAGRQALPAHLPPQLRLLVLGTAGTGKTHSAKIGINEVRLTFGSYDSVLTLAFTGVASANLGSGSRTIDSVFHTNQSAAHDDLAGAYLDQFVNEMESVELLVIDEVSTCGAASLEVINRRMQQVARVLWRNRFRSPPPDDMGPFGGIGVLLMGDFAQLPPVLATSVLPGMPLTESGGATSRAMALAGRQTFTTFEDVLRLRRIHRQKGVDAFKDSTMRLRDAANTLEDYELWKTHELDSLDPEVDCPWEGGENLRREALVMVPENAPAGKINGMQLAARAPMHGAPGPASAANVVVRCESRHNHERGERRKADDFRQVRFAVHLCVGARVMLSQNRIWGVPTVPLGLMNGARGVVVAILYAPQGTDRVDGSDLAGAGYPTATPGFFPRGKVACPLPEYVVVHFPDYAGPSLWEASDLPRTWVPIPCAEVMHKTFKSVVRVGVPLRLAWALTIHKSQGITAREGCIVSFAGSRASAAVGKMGLAFVAWTRATSWARMAFHKLPRVEDFIAARLSREFEARSAFEQRADSMFASFLERRGTSVDALLAAHEQDLTARTQNLYGRLPTEEELMDLRAMLSTTGVAPVSDSIANYCAEHSGRKGAGIWSIVAAFRAQPKKASKRASRGSQPQASESGAQALPGIAKPQTQRHTDTHILAEAEDIIAQNMIGMGFKEGDITRALEKSDFNFERALLLLLNGIDEQRTKYDSRQRFRRHSLRNVKAIDSARLGQSSVLEQYKRRARDEFGLEATVWDFGQYAGKTSGACFWLSLTAGLAECNRDVLAQALPGDHQARVAMSALKAVGLRKCYADGVKDTPLGVAAEALRNHFCRGPDAVMLRPAIRAMLFQAFATLDVHGPAHALEMYGRWVAKLAVKEYADELVLLCVVQELPVQVSVIPFTPSTALNPWATSTYSSQSEAAHSGTVHLGNNDLHYVYLAGHTNDANVL